MILSTPNLLLIFLGQIGPFSTTPFALPYFVIIVNFRLVQAMLTSVLKKYQCLEDLED